jgi:phenylpropionate dioxygenase-like ring-hydroxylating dioxygenase large terminal subunit
LFWEGRTVEYLRNAWYVAAFGDELAEAPIRRVLFDMPIVMFRGESGAISALLDRCPHRFVPLSRGKVVGDHLECGYHGLRFDRSGACVLNPHGGGHVPASAKVRSFPVLERHELVWFWPGDPSKTDPRTIPSEFAVLQSSRIRSIRGYLHVKANYQLIVDNLLDLSHTIYIHPQFSATSSATSGVKAAAPKIELQREPDGIWARRSMDNVPATDLNRRMGATAELVNFRSHMRWFAPALLYFDLGFTECTEEAADFPQPGTHFVTPETELSSHYFFSQGRSTELDSKETDEFVRRSVLYAFGEQDEPMLEAQQAALGQSADLMGGKPVLLKTDAAPLAARRFLEEMIKRERA